MHNAVEWGAVGELRYIAVIHTLSGYHFTSTILRPRAVLFVIHRHEIVLAKQYRNRSQLVVAHP